MRKYRSNASSAVRFVYGVELVAGLSRFSETAPAANDIEDINDALDAQHQKRLALRVPVVKSRAAARFAEYDAERAIRLAVRSAEMEDGGRRGRICAAVFPKGATPILTPKGKGQVKALKELVDRLDVTKVAGIDAYRAAWLPKLKTTLEALQTALDAYAEAQAAHDDAFRIELALRDAHHDAVDKAMGQVRAAFPRDRAVQDVIFPIPDDEPKEAKEADSAEETEGAEAGAEAAHS